MGLGRISASLIVTLVVAYGYAIQYIFLPSITLYIIIGIVTVLGMRYILSLRVHHKKLIFYIPLLISSLFITVVSQAPHFVFALAIAIAYIAERKSSASMVRAYFWSSIFFFVLTIILYAVGILPDNMVYRATETETLMRSSLGFINPNSPMLYVLPIFIAGYYLYGRGLSYYLLSLPVVALLYFATNSRTGLACTLLFFAATWIFAGWKKVTRLQRFVFGSLFFLLGIFSIVLAVNVGADQSSGLNELLSNRLYFWSYYIENHLAFSLFGSEVVKGFTLDNMYIYILVKLGVLAFIVYSIVYFIGIKHIDNDKRMILAIAAFLVYGLSETNIILSSVSFALPLVLMSTISRWTKYRIGDNALARTVN